MSFSPAVASGRSTHAGSVRLPLLHTPLLMEASQYPLSLFQESRIPSPSLFLTVVLTMTAPHETHPWLLEEGTTCVVAKLASSVIGLALLKVIGGCPRFHTTPEMLEVYCRRAMEVSRKNSCRCLGKQFGTYCSGRCQRCASVER